MDSSTIKLGRGSRSGMKGKAPLGHTFFDSFGTSHGDIRDPGVEKQRLVK